MIIIADLQTLFQPQGAGIFIVHLHTEFHVPSPNSLLVTTILPEAKDSFSTADILFHSI
jgi:hypothetical protein